MNPEFTRQATGGLFALSGQQGRQLGFVPHPLKLDHLKGLRTLAGKAPKALPTSYDLRRQGRVSPVKDQGPAGTCWAFASYGSMESCLLPGESWNFSENNMKNLLSEDCPQGFDRPPDGGGNELMAAAYLARWSGPVTEAQDPYDPHNGGLCTELDPQKHLTRVVFVPDRQGSTDNDNLKTAIMNYGAVFTSLYYDDSAYQETNSAYYYNGRAQANHAICLVGWNDLYSKSNFKSRPSGDGAYIAQNSWGTSWGDQGFFYISYYDSVVGTANALFNRSDSPDTFKVNYQYDPLGWVTSIGYGQSSAWLANRFQASGDHKVGAVAWYAASPESSYELYIYLDPTASDPRSGQQALALKGSSGDPAYFTRVLPTAVNLKKGQWFSVALKINTPGYNYPVPVQMPISGYSSQAQAGSGKSFISLDGSQWEDITTVWSNTSVCIKAIAL